MLNLEMTERKHKLSGVGLQLDATAWCIVVFIIAAVVIGTIFNLRDTAKTSAAKLEMSNMRDAIMQYEGLRLDGQPPATLKVLLDDPCIPAAEAIDSKDHGPLLPTNNTRWANGNVVDMWGKEYLYEVNSDGSGGSIISTGGGSNLQLDF